MRGMDEGDDQTSKGVSVLTVVCTIYGFAWCALAWTGWGPAALQQPGPWRTAAILLFYLACVELLMSRWLHRRVTRRRSHQLTG